MLASGTGHSAGGRGAMGRTWWAAEQHTETPLPRTLGSASFAELGLKNFWEAITCDLSQHAQLLEQLVTAP
jgi:hypothetical protein